MNRLTQQQQSVYDFIRQCMMTRGYGPTVREIGLHMNIKSPNGVMCHLRALEKKGVIHRSANKSRAIELTDPLPRGETPIEIRGCVASGEVLLNTGLQRSFELSKLLGEGENYLLEVGDDSLLAAEISGGDQLIVRKQNQATAGQLIVATVNSGAVVVGHFRQQSGQTHVQPLTSGSTSSAQPVTSILGVIVGLIRLWPPLTSENVS